jgi:hypothetical protein
MICDASERDRRGELYTYVDAFGFELVGLGHIGRDMRHMALDNEIPSGLPIRYIYVPRSLFVDINKEFGQLNRY